MDITAHPVVQAIGAFFAGILLVSAMEFLIFGDKWDIAVALPPALIGAVIVFIKARRELRNPKS